jgi:uncharacterized membrane protein YccC
MPSTWWRGPRRIAAAALDRLRQRGQKAVVRALRLTTAAAAAYLVADLLFPGTRPLLAPLTALLVVQVTLYSTLTTGLQRIASVVAGVVVAVLFSALVGFSWWSLALLIAAAILVGQLLQLREQMLEVPISAMLVLAVGRRRPRGASPRLWSAPPSVCCTTWCSPVRCSPELPASPCSASPAR